MEEWNANDSLVHQTNAKTGPADVPASEERKLSQIYSSDSEEFVVETRYCFKLFNLFYIRDWSLVMGRGGGGTAKWENRGSVTFCARPPVWLKL